MFIASIAGFAASSAVAQNEPTDPAPGNAQQVEDARAILPRVGTNETPVSPTRASTSEPVQPGLTQGQDWLKILHETLETKIGASTLAEGAFVLARQGDLVKAPNGLLIFVPDRETSEPGEGAVLMMPCQTLEQLQSEWTGQRVLLSGEIFTYHNRNQLLISDYRLVSETANELPTSNDETTESEPGTVPETQNPIEADPDVRDLLDELNRSQPRTESPKNEPLGDRVQTLPRTPVQRTASPNAGPEEGTLLLRRPARMLRNAQGAWTLVFDNDDHDKTAADGLIVLPCRALMRMELWTMQQGDAARFLVSGRVYTYEGQSYLLPTLAQRLGASDLNSIQ